MQMILCIFLVEFDEAHKIMNARFPVAVQQLTDMQREMRKVFGGLILATQSISECMPDNASAENVQQIKDLFAFSNYKFIGIQDESLVPKLKQAFGTSLTDTEYAKIPKLQQGNFILQFKEIKILNLKCLHLIENLIFSEVVLNDRYKQYKFKFCRRTNTGL